MRELFAIPDFRRLWTAQTTSSFGDALTNLALLLAAQRLTGSTTAVAVTAIAVAIPQLLFGLLAGVLVDRWDRRRVMVAADVVRAVLVLGFIAVTDADRMWLLYTIAFVQATIGTFFNPARSALLPKVVGTDHLLAANSFTQSSLVVASVLGTGAAGLIIGLTDALAPVFLIDGLTFLVSAMLVTRLRVDTTPTTPRRSMAASHLIEELVAGLRIITASRQLRSVLIGAGVVMFGLGAVNVLMVPFIVEDLAVPESWFGLLEASQVAAMVITGGVVAALASRIKAGRLLVGGLAGIGVVVATMSLSTNVWHLVGLLFAAGCFVAPTQAAISTIVQTEVATETLGRVSSSQSTIITAAQVASMALAGVAADALGVRQVFVLAGVISVVAAFLTAASLGSPHPLAPSTVPES
jgi:MFS family permease